MTWDSTIRLDSDTNSARRDKYNSEIIFKTML